MIQQPIQPTAITAFTAPAPEERIAGVAAALVRHNIEAIVVDTGAEARARVLAMIPESSEVHWGKSKTLVEIELTPELLTSGRYDPLRPRYMAMDRATQGREIRKLQASPDVMLGSVQAITDDGALIAVSYGGSQIGPYASGAGRLILVVGSQKIVRDLDEGAAPRPGTRPALGGRRPPRRPRGPHETRQDARDFRRVTSGPDHGRPRAGAGRDLTAGRVRPLLRAAVWARLGLRARPLTVRFGRRT